MLHPLSIGQKEGPKLNSNNSQLGNLRALQDYNKRGRSMLSLQSFQTSQSKSAARPLTKKPKLVEGSALSSQSATNINANDVFADDTYPAEMDAMPRVNEESEQPGGKISLTPDTVEPPSDADYMCGLARATDGLTLESFSLSMGTHGSNPLSSNISENPSLRRSSWICSIAEESILSARWGSAEELVKSVTQVDLDRPIDNFSEEEITNIKEAADYLTSFRYEAEAFPLYVLLLKRHRARLGDQTHGPCYPVFTSSQAAMLRGHSEILQNLLQLELDKAQQTASTLELFLAHMLLAETYCHGYNRTRPDDVKRHLEMAKPFFSGVDLIRLLPEYNRSLDFLAWHNIIRCLTGSPDLLLEEYLEYWEMKEVDTISKVQDVENAFLRRIPGPFEMRDDVMGNRCLPFCVQWCNSELSHISKLPVAWKTTNDSLSGFTYANTTALFTFLWDRWHEIQSAYPNPHLDLWVRETEARMGIPSAELLMTVCMMISDITRPKKLSKRYLNLLDISRLGVQALLQLTDKELARLFLRNNHARYNIGSIQWRRERAVLQSVARSHIFGLMKRALRVAVPERSASTPEATATSGQPLQTLKVLAVTILPTMASSLKSSEYSSLRKLRDRIKRTSNTAVPAAAALPLRNSSKSIFSLQTMSELSVAMEKSLSLSPMRAHGNLV